MRTFSTNFSNALNQDTIYSFVLIDLTLNTGTFRYTDLPYDVSVDGFTYSSSGVIMSYSSPRYSTNLDREIYTISFTDPDDLLLTEIGNGVSGKDIRVRFGAMDINKVPFLSSADLVDGYIGTVDGVVATNNFEEKIIKIEGASPMSDLDLVNGLIVSADGMDQVSATDTAFDTVLDGTEVEIKWGKA